MMALLGPTDRPRGGVRWGLVVHTVAMFLCVTIYTAATLDTQSISYVEDRRFPGVDGWPPGSLGYQFFVYSEPITVVPSVMFTLNQLLADGLLVSPTFSSIPRAPDAGRSPSSIVVTSFIP